MDIIANWKQLTRRATGELNQRLFQIHMGAFEDLRRSGHLLSINGKSVAQLARELPPEERLTLAGQVGRNLIAAEGDLFTKRFTIKLADAFPNCVFIALAATLENLDGAFDAVHPDRKMKITCAYEPGAADPLGQILPTLALCYGWIDLEIQRGSKPAPQMNPAPQVNPTPQEKPGSTPAPERKGLFAKLFGKKK